MYFCCTLSISLSSSNELPNWDRDIPSILKCATMSVRFSTMGKTDVVNQIFFVV